MKKEELKMVLVGMEAEKAAMDDFFCEEGVALMAKSGHHPKMTKNKRVAKDKAVKKRRDAIEKVKVTREEWKNDPSVWYVGRVTVIERYFDDDGVFHCKTATQQTKVYEKDLWGNTSKRPRAAGKKFCRDWEPEKPITIPDDIPVDGPDEEDYRYDRRNVLYRRLPLENRVQLDRCAQYLHWEEALNQMVATREKIAAKLEIWDELISELEKQRPRF